MPWFYTTVEKIEQFNIAVEAEDEERAIDQAIVKAMHSDSPDHSDIQVTFIEEAKRHVE